MLESSEVANSQEEQTESSGKRSGKSRGLRLKREATIGDLATVAGHLLTIITIFISALTLRQTYISYREERNKRQADQIRSAATETLAKIERWESASLSYYKNLEPVFVDVSLMLAKGSGPVSARDFLWKKLSEERAAVEQKKNEEKIETSYAALVIYYQPEPQGFIDSIRQLKEADESEFNSFRDEVIYLVSEPVRLSFYIDAYGRLDTAGLYKKLIEIADQHRSNLRENLSPMVGMLNRNLTGTVSKSDEDIVNSDKPTRKGG